MRKYVGIIFIDGMFLLYEIFIFVIEVFIFLVGYYLIKFFVLFM